MRINRYALLILICSLIQSCASISTQRLQSGKVSFMSGDFKSAFHQLLPLAAEGIPQAEYGVGYMYYYGYGVTQDNESGIFWMNKAATAHYTPAIRALAAIQENNAKKEENKYSRESAPARVNNTQAENNHIEKDAILEVLNNTMPPRQDSVIAAPQNNQAALIKTELQKTVKISDTTALPYSAHANSKKYTLQLLGSYYLSSLKERQAELNLGASTYIGKTTHNGRTWYVLTLGQYTALSQAALAKLDLPKRIKNFKPWIRECDELTWVG